MIKIIIATNCNKTRNCINLFEYFLLVSPPLNKVPIPSINTIPTEIKNLQIYFDPPITLAKKFGLRGIPTSIIFNKKGEEFARIIGSTDFADEKFINWLSEYN